MDLEHGNQELIINEALSIFPFVIAREREKMKIEDKIYISYPVKEYIVVFAKELLSFSATGIDYVQSACTYFSEKLILY